MRIRINLSGTLSVLATLLLVTVASTACAFNASQDIWLERYTVLPTGSVQWDIGHLSGAKFRVVNSIQMGPSDLPLMTTIEDLRAVSGQLIMPPQLFDEYKAARVIPKWTRSQQVYRVGFVEYVTVTPKGFKPIAIQTPKALVVEVKAGRSAKLQVRAQGSGPREYQWYFNRTPPNRSNTDPSYVSYWYSLFTPIPGATKSSYRIPKAQAGNEGAYYVIVENGLSSAQSDTISLSVLP